MESIIIIYQNAQEIIKENPVVAEQFFDFNPLPAQLLLLKKCLEKIYDFI